MLTDNGLLGVRGPHAAKLVEEDLRLDAGDVILHHHLEVVNIVLENLRIQYDATQRLVRPVSIKILYMRSYEN